LPYDQQLCSIGGEPSVGTGLIVISGEIPKANDRQDAEVLTLYERLRHPVPLLELPDSQRLQEIRSILEREFSWAHDVIAVFIDDLAVRRAHGSLRLNLQPTLLIGDAGVGKTHFAQRLSELINVP